MTFLECYLPGGSHPIIRVPNVGAVPQKGDLLNLRGRSYRVETVSWAIDYADSSYAQSELCCNVRICPLTSELQKDPSP